MANPLQDRWLNTASAIISAAWVVGVIFMASLSACGNDDDSDPESYAPPPAVEGATTTTPADVGDDYLMEGETEHYRCVLSRFDSGGLWCKPKPPG